MDATNTSLNTGNFASLPLPSHPSHLQQLLQSEAVFSSFVAPHVHQLRQTAVHLLLRVMDENRRLGEQCLAEDRRVAELERECAQMRRTLLEACGEQRRLVVGVAGVADGDALAMASDEQPPTLDDLSFLLSDLNARASVPLRDLIIQRLLSNMSEAITRSNSAMAPVTFDHDALQAYRQERRKYYARGMKHEKLVELVAKGQNGE